MPLTVEKDEFCEGQEVVGMLYSLTEHIDLQLGRPVRKLWLFYKYFKDGDVSSSLFLKPNYENYYKDIRFLSKG